MFAFFGMPGPAEMMVLSFLMILALPVLSVLPFWFICEKAGFHGALSLWMLIPVAQIILPFYLAFADWPALQYQQVDGAADPS